MLTALQLAEQLELLAGHVKSERVRGALKLAEKQLRGAEKEKPLTEAEVRQLMDNLERGMEFAVYVEDRGYPMPMPALLDRKLNDSIHVMYSNGMRYVLEMKDYNRTWRLWGRYPSGVEMKLAEWRDRK